MKSEEQLLASSIFNTLAEAHAIEVQYGNLAMSNAEHPGDIDSEIEEADCVKIISSYILKLYRDVAILAERLDLPLFAKVLHGEAKNISKVELEEVHQNEYSFSFRALARVKEYFKSLNVMVAGTELTGLMTLQRILEQTPAILRKRRIEPSKEKDVKDAVEEVLRFAFPDVTKETGIQGSFKVYRFDLGVTSLYSAIEYKYAATETEFKKCIDDLYTDVIGYSGSNDWRNFFAVVYCTEQFAREDDMQKAFARADRGWRPILVHGPGQRAHKKGGAGVAKPPVSAST